MANPIGNFTPTQGGFKANGNPMTNTNNRQVAASFPGTNIDSQVGKDIYSAPDQSQFNSRTFPALLQGAGVNTLNPYGTGGQWLQEQSGPMYWLMRARMALDPATYGQENDPNAVSSYFQGGQGLNTGSNFLSGPASGQQAVQELLYGNHDYLNNVADPRTQLMGEWMQNPSLMAAGVGNLMSSGMAGDAARFMANYIQQITNQVINNPQTMQGSNPVQALANRLGQGL
jgi:hypothetical protein